jgi:hypothetical protein
VLQLLAAVVVLGAVAGPLHDSALLVRYRPRPGWRMRVARAELDYEGTDEDWARDCAVWDRMSGARWPTESSRAVGGLDIELAALHEEPAAQGQSSA